VIYGLRVTRSTRRFIATALKNKRWGLDIVS
jgi:hypothetical protein